MAHNFRFPIPPIIRIQPPLVFRPPVIRAPRIIPTYKPPQTRIPTTKARTATTTTRTTPVSYRSAVQITSGYASPVAAPAPAAVQPTAYQSPAPASAPPQRSAIFNEGSVNFDLNYQVSAPTPVPTRQPKLINVDVEPIEENIPELVQLVSDTQTELDIAAAQAPTDNPTAMLGSLPLFMANLDAQAALDTATTHAFRTDASGYIGEPRNVYDQTEAELLSIEIDEPENAEILQDSVERSRQSAPLVEPATANEAQAQVVAAALELEQVVATTNIYDINSPELYGDAQDNLEAAMERANRFEANNGSSLVVQQGDSLSSIAQNNVDTILTSAERSQFTPGSAEETSFAVQRLMQANPQFGFNPALLDGQVTNAVGDPDTLVIGSTVNETEFGTYQLVANTIDDIELSDGARAIVDNSADTALEASMQDPTSVTEAIAIVEFRREQTNNAALVQQAYAFAPNFGDSSFVPQDVATPAQENYEQATLQLYQFTTQNATELGANPFPVIDAYLAESIELNPPTTTFPMQRIHDNAREEAMLSIPVNDHEANALFLESWATLVMENDQQVVGHAPDSIYIDDDWMAAQTQFGQVLTNRQIFRGQTHDGAFANPFLAEYQTIEAFVTEAAPELSTLVGYHNRAALVNARETESTDPSMLRAQTDAELFDIRVVQDANADAQFRLSEELNSEAPDQDIIDALTEEVAITDALIVVQTQEFDAARQREFGHLEVGEQRRERQIFTLAEELGIAHGVEAREDLGLQVPHPTEAANRRQAEQDIARFAEINGATDNEIQLPIYTGDPVALGTAAVRFQSNRDATSTLSPLEQQDEEFFLLQQRYDRVDTLTAQIEGLPEDDLAMQELLSNSQIAVGIQFEEGLTRLSELQSNPTDRQTHENRLTVTRWLQDQASEAYDPDTATEKERQNFLNLGKLVAIYESELAMFDGDAAVQVSAAAAREFGEAQSAPVHMQYDNDTRRLEVYVQPDGESDDDMWASANAAVNGHWSDTIVFNPDTMLAEGIEGLYMYNPIAGYGPGHTEGSGVEITEVEHNEWKVNLQEQVDPQVIEYYGEEFVIDNMTVTYDEDAELYMLTYGLVNKNDEFDSADDVVVGVFDPTQHQLWDDLRARQGMSTDHARLVQSLTLFSDEQIEPFRQDVLDGVDVQTLTGQDANIVNALLAQREAEDNWLLDPSAANMDAMHDAGYQTFVELRVGERVEAGQVAEQARAELESAHQDGLPDSEIRRLQQQVADLEQQLYVAATGESTAKSLALQAVDPVNAHDGTFYEMFQEAPNAQVIGQGIIDQWALTAPTEPTLVASEREARLYVAQQHLAQVKMPTDGLQTPVDGLVTNPLYTVALDDGTTINMNSVEDYDQLEDWQKEMLAPIVEAVWEETLDKQGGHVQAVPVVYSSETSGVITQMLYRTIDASGDSRIVDIDGSHFANEDEYRRKNRTMVAQGEVLSVMPEEGEIRRDENGHVILNVGDARIESGWEEFKRDWHVDTVMTVGMGRDCSHDGLWRLYSGRTTR